MYSFSIFLVFVLVVSWLYFLSFTTRISYGFLYLFLQCVSKKPDDLATLQAYFLCLLHDVGVEEHRVVTSLGIVLTMTLIGR